MPRFPRPTVPGWYWMKRHEPSRQAREIIIVEFTEDAFPFPDDVHVNDEFMGPLNSPWPENPYGTFKTQCDGDSDKSGRRRGKRAG